MSVLNYLPECVEYQEYHDVETGKKDIVISEEQFRHALRIAYRDGWNEMGTEVEKILKREESTGDLSSKTVWVAKVLLRLPEPKAFNGT